MNAPFVLAALAQRHARKDDLYAEEVQCGRAGLRLDAVSMARSWSAKVIGYEVKVSLADLRADVKIHLYLDWVDRLYIVCPPNIVEEARKRGVGVMRIDDDGNLRIVQRAPNIGGARRAELFQGLLINRAFLLRRSFFALNREERAAARAQAADGGEVKP